MCTLQQIPLGSSARVSRFFISWCASTNHLRHINSLICLWFVRFCSYCTVVANVHSHLYPKCIELQGFLSLYKESVIYQFVKVASCEVLSTWWICCAITLQYYSSPIASFPGSPTVFDYSILTEFELDSVVVDCHRGLLLEKQWEQQSKTTMNRNFLMSTNLCLKQDTHKFCFLIWFQCNFGVDNFWHLICSFF